MSRVAIITRTVDRPVLLERMIRSLLDQTYAGWECVIVNSGMSEPVDALLNKHAAALRGRCTQLPYVNPMPGMRGLPLNAGIAATKSEFITVLDDDDTWSPSFLETMVHALMHKPHPNVRGAVCRTRCLDESSVEEGLVMLREYDLDADLCNINLAHLAMVNRFCVHAFVYERAALETVGLYPEDYPVLEDWHFNLRFLQHYEVLVVPQTLTHYHFRPQETTGADANSQRAERGDHKFHEARLINEAIREDFRTGKPGLGHLLAQAALARHLADRLHKQEGRLQTISAKTGKIDARTKEMKDKLNN